MENGSQLSVNMPGHRFFVDRFVDDQVIITNDEAHHLQRVLRLGVGAEIGVFDGQGQEVIATITHVTKSLVTAQIIERLSNSVESPLAITLVQGLIKGDKFDLVIQKATELGVSQIQPLIMEYTDVKLSDERAEKRLERWQRIALEATKQCGRRTLTKILPPVDWATFLLNTNPAINPVICFAERQGSSLAQITAVLKAQGTTKIIAVVGSEGGWASSELNQAEAAGYHFATLGARILRAETAGITVVALLQYLLGDLA